MSWGNGNGLDLGPEKKQSGSPNKKSCVKPTKKHFICSIRSICAEFQPSTKNSKDPKTYFFSISAFRCLVIFTPQKIFLKSFNLTFRSFRLVEICSLHNGIQWWEFQMWTLWVWWWWKTPSVNGTVFMGDGGGKMCFVVVAKNLA